MAGRVGSASAMAGGVSYTPSGRSSLSSAAVTATRMQSLNFGDARRSPATQSLIPRVDDREA